MGFPIAIDAFVVGATAESPAWTARCLVFARCLLSAAFLVLVGISLDFVGSVASAGPLVFAATFPCSNLTFLVVVTVLLCFLIFFAFLYAFFVLL